MKLSWKKFVDKIIAIVLIAGLASLTFSCSGSPNTSSSSFTGTPTKTGDMHVLQYGYRVIQTYPHDKQAFTQGLVFEKGVLYEGTGLYEHSSLRKVELESGKVLQKKELPPDYFGEGITVFDNKIIQLTWKEKVGLVYDLSSFALLRKFNYNSEGWGITQDDKNLIISDGSNLIYKWEPENYQTLQSIGVHEGDIPVTRINELEYVNGKILANIWQTDKIAMIEPETGQIVGWINLEGLLATSGYTGTVDVLNGIAYDSANNRLFVTGKLWPYMFHIELVRLN